MDNKNIIGNRINSALVSNDTKQKELAQKAGVKDNVVSYWCSGARIPNTEQIIKIAKALNVSTDYLLGLTDTPTPLKTDDDKALRISCDYTGLNKEAIDAMHNYNELAVQQLGNAKDKANDYLTSFYTCLASLIETFIYSLAPFIEEVSKYRELQSELFNSYKVFSFTEIDKCKSIYNEFIENEKAARKKYKIAAEQSIENYLKGIVFNDEKEHFLSKTSLQENDMHLNYFVYKLQSNFMNWVNRCTHYRLAESEYNQAIELRNSVFRNVKHIVYNKGKE